MKNSWKIGEITGIGIHIHWSFLILPGWVAISALTAGGGLPGAVGAVLFVLAVFVCIVLHELGHALAARHFGIGTRDITLLPIGGVARLERMPKQPGRELAVALAGPAVNAVIAVSLFIGLQLTGGLAAAWAGHFVGSAFLANLAWVNAALVAFNLIPAFPMDGGRVLRALLALRMSHLRATDIAAAVGGAMAILLGAVGLYTGSLTMILVAAFVFFAGRSEAHAVRTESEMQDVACGHPETAPCRVYVFDVDGGGSRQIRAIHGDSLVRETWWGTRLDESPDTTAYQRS